MFTLPTQLAGYQPDSTDGRLSTRPGRRPLLNRVGVVKAHPVTSVIILLLTLFTQPLAGAQNNSLFERLEHAAALIRDNRIGEAEQQLNSILKASPNEPQSLNLLGTIRAKQGRLDEAETLFTRALSINNQLVPAHWNLAYLYLLKSAPEKTILQLKEILSLEPNNSDALSRLAHLLLAQNHTDECISFIETAKGSHPVSADLLVLLGDAYLEKSNPEKANDNYLLALGKESDNANALLGLAQISQSRGDRDKALFYLGRVKDLSANSPDLLYGYAQAALRSRLDSEAIAAMKRAAQLKPEEPSYLFALGYMWLEIGKPDLFEAELAFRQFVKLQPNNVQGLLHLGYVLLEQKKYTEAREWFERSINVTTTMPEPFYYLGFIAQEQNDDERAVELLEKAIRLAPSYADAHAVLGSSYLKLKNYPCSLQELELAIKLNPNDSKAHYNLAMLYARLKDYRKSQEEMAIVEKLKTGGSAQSKEIAAPRPPDSNPR